MGNLIFPMIQSYRHTYVCIVEYSQVEYSRVESSQVTSILLMKKRRVQSTAKGISECFPNHWMLFTGRSKMLTATTRASRGRMTDLLCDIVIQHLHHHYHSINWNFMWHAFDMFALRKMIFITFTWYPLYYTNNNMEMMVMVMMIIIKKYCVQFAPW